MLGGLRPVTSLSEPPCLHGASPAHTLPRMVRTAKRRCKNESRLLHPLNVRLVVRLALATGILASVTQTRVPKRARDSRLEPGPSPVLLKCPVPTTLSAGWGAPAGWRERCGQVARHPAFAGPGPRREPEATPAHSAPGTPARARRTSQQPHTAEVCCFQPATFGLICYAAKLTDTVANVLLPTQL